MLNDVEILPFDIPCSFFVRVVKIPVTILKQLLLRIMKGFADAAARNHNL